jgi:putative transposase
LEVLALRQQMAVLKRKRRRPVLNRLDRLFWIILRSVWPRWSDVLHSVKPATVIVWHRRGFRLYWRWRSRPRGGRPRISEEVRCLIRQMRLENLDWGAPKIHGELLKLGFQVSEPTVARYLQRLRPRTGKPDQRWKAVLANDREAIVVFDFFTVPTLTFQLLYCFLIIEHGRRRVLHCNVTAHPTSEWIVQQLREASPKRIHTGRIHRSNRPFARSMGGRHTSWRSQRLNTPALNLFIEGAENVLCRSCNRIL